MISLEHPIVESYLQEVANALRAVDPERRNEILEQIADHIVAATAELAPGDESGVRQVLDRLGPPADIAMAADVAPYGMPSPGAERITSGGIVTPPRGISEKLALVAFILSPLFCLLGWLIGVVLLWTSRIWTTRHKIIGTLATLPFALMIVLAGMVSLTTVRATRTLPASVESSVTMPAVTTPTVTVFGDDSPAPTSLTSDPLPAVDTPEVTRTSDTRQWSLRVVLTIAGWALVLLIVPLTTIIWLGRALAVYQRNPDEHRLLR